MQGQIFSVIPSQKRGDRPESDKESFQLLKGSAPSEYKQDFETNLRKKFEVQNKELLKKNSQSDPKKSLRKKEDSETEGTKKTSKSSGGNKKKMAKQTDNQQISNIMASNENEVEITELTTDSDLTADSTVTELTENSENKNTNQNDFFNERSISQFDDHSGINGEVDSKNESGIELGQDSFENQLKAEVGFENSETTVANEMKQKLNSFENEKQIFGQNAKDFEKSVLEQLQKAHDQFAFSQSASIQSNEAGGSTFDSQDAQQDQDMSGDKNKFSDISTSINAQPLHSGQTHTEFQNHFALSKVGDSSAAQSATKTHDMNAEANIKEIMNKASFLVNAGGGEMTVQMTPEGLSAVHLKVMLQDGKVSVDLQTKDPQVKKMIEESLSELKSGLAAHHLTVENFKVDSIQTTNTNNSAQFQSPSQQNGQQQAGDMWNRFQQRQFQQQNEQRQHRQISSSDAHVSSGAVANKTTLGKTDTALRTYGGTKGSQINRVA